MIKRCIILVSAFIAIMADCYGFQYKDLYYKITSSTNMTVEVTSGDKKYKEESYTIPDNVEYNGETYYVTKIGSYAFSGCTNLERIWYESDKYLKTIGDHAFSGCNGLKYFGIPKSVTSIGNYAFSGCLSLERVVIDDATTSLSLGYGAMNGSGYGLFADAPLTSFYWGRPLSYDTSYGRSPIANHPNLSEITIGPNVPQITAYMFYGNSSITSIELPTTVTSLGNHAFHGFVGLKSFTIPEHITSVGEYAFAGCTGLTSFTVPEWITSIGAGTFSGCTGLTSFTIPNNVESIGNYAFSGCTGIKKLKIEKGKEIDNVILSLGYGANNGPGYGLFYDCPLESVDLQRDFSYQTSYSAKWNNSTKDYSNRSPFREHPTLKKTTIGEEFAYINDYMFFQAKYLEEVNLPNTLETIGICTFYGCESLNSITIPASVTTFKNYAFAYCTGLSSFTFGSNLNSIGNYVFSGCTGIKTLKFEKGKEIDKVNLSLGYGANDGPGYGLFYDCPLESVDLQRKLSYQTSYSAKWNNSTKDYSYRSPFREHPTLKKATIGEEITYVNDCLFDWATKLTDVSLPNTAVTIGNNVFNHCESLTSIDIPASVTTIGSEAFSNCIGFESFTIGSGVASIGNSAFAGCTSLISFTVPNNVNSIGNYAFSGCTGIKELKIEKGKEIDNVILSLGYGANNGPGYGLFYDCPLESVDLQRDFSYQTSYSAKWNNSTKDYSNRSPFREHPTLKKATIGEEFAYINDYMFFQAKYLEEVNLPNKLETIGICTFYGCESLNSITIPASVTTFKNYAFAYCTGLSSFTFGSNLNSIGNYVFSGCTGIKTLKFEKGKDVDRVLLTLGYGANDGPGYGLFYDCPLESVDLQRDFSYQTSYSAKWNNSTKDYSNRSPFREHPTLKKTTIGEEFAYINDYMFFQAKYLEEVNLPNTLETIGICTFYGCESLNSITIPASVTTFKNYAFAYCTGLSSFTFGSNLNSIGNYVFSGCTGIKTLKFEKGKEIDKVNLSLGYGANDGPGYGLFYDCPLESVDLQRELSYQTSYSAKWNNSTKDYSNRSPFRDHPTLTEASIGEGAGYIGSNLFYGNSLLKTVTISEGLTSIGSCAFYNCETITSLVLPQSLETIGNYAFGGCKQLTGLIFHPALKSIGNYAFQGCVAFNNFAIEESEETLALGNGSSEGEKTGLFKDCPITSVFIGRNLSYNYSPLANMATLTEARFGNPVTRIPNYIFQGDTELSNVVFNKSCELQSVGKYAFDGCVNLPTPQFPSTVTAFDEGAFKGCVNFTGFELPKNLVSIGAYTFQDCTGLTEFNIPAMTTSIGNYAFSGCTGVKQVIFADGDETLAMGYGASQGKAYGLFRDCPLETLYLGRTLSYTEKKDNGYSPFAYVSTLSEVTIGANVKSLGYCIFYSTAISEVYLPSSVRTIHSSSFNNCNNLKKVIILGVTPPTTDTYNTMFANSAEDSKIYVFFPDNYKSAKIWKDYADKIEAVGEIYSNFTYSGEGHVIGYKTDFPIVLDNRDTEAVDAGTYQKRIDVTYTTNGYSIKDVLNYEYSIKKAPLTITAESCSRNFGEENPEFKFIYDGFVNDEDEKVLTKEPTATTKATVNSPTGEYDIVVSGAEAKNYNISYVNGKLTIVSAQQTLGDANGDGELNAADIIAIMSFISGNAGSITLEKADVNGDGVVNIADIIAVSNIIAGKE